MRIRLLCLFLTVFVVAGLFVSPVSVPALVRAQGATGHVEIWVQSYREGIRYSIEQAWFTRTLKSSQVIQSSLDAMANELQTTPPRVSGDASRDIAFALDYFRNGFLRMQNQAPDGGEEFFRKAIEGLIKPWDSFAVALNRIEWLFAMFISGFFEDGDGIMMRWSEEKKAYVVVDVLPDMGGEKAGILVGDEIVAIEGIKTADITNSDSYGFYRKARQAGKLLYRVRRGSIEFDVVVEQTIPKERSIKYELRQSGVGYIVIPTIATFTGLEVVDAVGELIAQGARSFVIDLRKNPGGNLVATWIALSVFLQGDLFVRRTRSDSAVLKRLPVEQSFNGPVAILVDRYSASAAEIFAMALTRRPKTRIFGDNSERTYGKGVGQIAFRLSNGWYFSITVSEFADLGGIPYHGKGITVDEMVQAQGSASNDAVLERALEWLKLQK